MVTIRQVTEVVDSCFHNYKILSFHDTSLQSITTLRHQRITSTSWSISELKPNPPLSGTTKLRTHGNISRNLAYEANNWTVCEASNLGFWSVIVMRWFEQKLWCGGLNENYFDVLQETMNHSLILFLVSLYLVAIKPLSRISDPIFATEISQYCKLKQQ